MSFLKGDFFAMELLDGYLYMHLDLGSGSLKLRASNRRLDDGTWHKVDVVRNRKRGNLQVNVCWGRNCQPTVMPTLVKKEHFSSLIRLRRCKKYATTRLFLPVFSCSSFFVVCNAQDVR